MVRRAAPMRRAAPRSFSMAFSVRSDLRYCRFAADYIFLCLRTDRYFLLRGNPADRLARFLSGDASRSDLAWLAEHELISDASGDNPVAREPIPFPTSSFRDTTIPSTSRTVVASVLVAQQLARRELAKRNLGAIVTSLGHASRAFHEIDFDAGLGVAAAFHRARHYAPAIDRCLVRGLAMKRMLLRRKCDARLVIGVAMPFSAHCWVQADDVVLTDTLDTVLPYSPILSV